MWRRPIILKDHSELSSEARPPLTITLLTSTEVHRNRNVLSAHLKTPVAPQLLETGPMLC
jgi:hypothetical protein